MELLIYKQKSSIQETKVAKEPQKILQIRLMYTIIIIHATVKKYQRAFINKQKKRFLSSGTYV